MSKGPPLEQDWTLRTVFSKIALRGLGGPEGDQPGLRGPAGQDTAKYVNHLLTEWCIPMFEISSDETI